MVNGLWSVFGIINVTPDSFSDGGRFASADEAVNAACAMIGHGADIIDVGGESTRPGADPVSAEEEAERVVPVIAGIHQRHPTIPISIDTNKAEVARQALQVGATIVNDVSAGCDPEMFTAVSHAGASMVLMHMHGGPRTMQERPQYEDVVAEVQEFLLARIEAARRAGIPRKRLLIDPGIGFGKTPAHNVTILQNLRSLTALGIPVLLGVSRKSLIGHLLGGVDTEERLEGGLAVLGLAAEQGVRCFRVHDVRATRRYLTIWQKLSAA